MKFDKKNLRDEFPAILFFLSFVVLFIWISGYRTPWRDEIVTLSYFLPGEFIKGMTNDVHHPIMYFFDYFIHWIGGSSEFSHRVFHGLFSVLGHIALYIGLRKKFSTYEALSIVLLATTWAGGIYFSTSLRSNWSLIVIPELIFGFYYSFKNMSFLKLIPLITIFYSLHMLNFVGIPFAFVLSSLWYEQRFPQKRILIAIGSALIASFCLYRLKFLILGPSSFSAWSAGLTRYSFISNLTSFSFGTPESRAWLPISLNSTIHYLTAEKILWQTPLVFLIISFLNGLKQTKERLICAGSLLFCAAVIYLGLIVSELIGLKLFLYRNLHFAYFLFWVALGIALFTQPKFKILSKIMLVLLVGFNIMYFFGICNYPKAGPKETKLAELVINLAKDENAVIIACDDDPLYKLYNIPKDLIQYSCDTFRDHLPQNRKYIVTQLSWIGLEGWKTVYTQLQKFGYTRSYSLDYYGNRSTEFRGDSHSEFIWVYNPPNPFFTPPQRNATSRDLR